MSIRLILLLGSTSFLTVYAWRDWFKALCGLVVLMALMETGDMPRNMLGIQGLNPWNILLISVLAAWLSERRFSRYTWDMPQHMDVLLVCYMGIILVGFVRAYFDSDILGISATQLVSDTLLNTFKWILPGIMLFDGARDDTRLKWAVLAILLLLLLVALQVYRVTPLAALTDGERLHETRLKFDRRVGYNAVDIAAMQAGAFWAAVVFMAWASKLLLKLASAAAAGIMLLALGLSGGRAGIVAWFVVGLTMCGLRWRKWLLLAPLAPTMFVMLFPGTVERSLRGFSEVDTTGQHGVELQEATSGRAIYWPIVIDKIGESPLVGHGRYAMMRTRLTHYFLDLLGERDAVAHPHNVYLAWALDNGLIGLLPILVFYGLVMIYSTRMFLSRHPLAMLVGGTAMSLTLAQLVAGLGSQSFYPTGGNFACWCAIFVMLRVVASTHGRTPAGEPVWVRP